MVAARLTPSGRPKPLGGPAPARVGGGALLRKPDAPRVNVPVRYVGFDIPSEFVVGYGLAYAERYRELPFVGVRKPSVYGRG